MRAIAEELSRFPEEAQPLCDWLRSQVPVEGDVNEELGYGAWFRVSDQQFISKSIDLRRMTEENQKFFCDAAKQANQREQSSELAKRYLAHLVQLIERFELGEDPMSMTDLRGILPLKDGPIGPGWDSKQS